MPKKERSDKPKEVVPTITIKRHRSRSTHVTEGYARNLDVAQPEFYEEESNEA
jgi:hypothetical protein